jgi:hypothetical protein
MQGAPDSASEAWIGEGFPLLTAGMERKADAFRAGARAENRLILAAQPRRGNASGLLRWNLARREAAAA